MTESEIIIDRRRFLSEIERHLALLQTDLTLQHEGYTYSYVIDFSALYAYLYKAFDSSSLPALATDTEARRFARQQVALQFVFSNSKRPVLLIPPYTSELRNHLDVLRLQINIADHGAREIFRDKLARLVERSREFHAFVQLHSSRRDSPDASMRQRLTWAKSISPSYTQWLCAPLLADWRPLRSCFRDVSCKIPKPVLPQMADFSFERCESLSMDWFRQINRIRHSKRAYQSLTDALACAYVERANERLNSERHAVLLYRPQITSGP